ncbi:MAG TPA: LLM class F420-dependent oxidoreductase [Alphaproteobacteria bacterium]|nr:LLM class F420-dependent oxidoreductase [Alphaproteobacteria bacterium]
MLIGVTVPNIGPLALSGAAVEIAEHAEQLGFASVWTVDHVVLPHVSSQSYPYTSLPGVSLPADWPMLDPLVTLAAIASRTSRVLLGTGVYLLPLRPPVINAKLAVSVDILSRGRLLFGVGLGWIREEYETLGVPWADRGRMFDEQIDLLRTLWRDAAPSFDGDFWRVGNIGFEPKPVNGTIPLLIGGKNDISRRRAAKRGDGWHLIDMEPEEVMAAKALLAEDCRTAGRAPEDVPVSMYASLLIAERDLPDNERQFPLMASVDRIVAKLDAYRAAGLDHVVLAARGLNTLKEYKELFGRIAGEILPRLDRRP